MARSISEIKATLTTQFLSNTTLQTKYGFTGTEQWGDLFGELSVENIWLYIVAVAMWTLETLFDQHVTEITNLLTNTKPSYVPWIVEMAKKFQFGYSLPDGAIYYDNTGVDDATVTASQVVKYCAVVELSRGVRVKIAGADSSGNLQPITGEQAAAFLIYIKRVLAVGTGVKLVNNMPDLLNLTLQVYYNPLVLGPTGKRLDGTSDTPVLDAINTYLESLPFNGRYVNAKMIDAVQNVDGVTIPTLTSSHAQYQSTDWLDFAVYFLPDSGYFKLNNVNITYVADTNI